MKKNIISILVLFFMLSGSLFSQVTVAPVTVHLNDADKNGYIIVRNNSSTSPWEVSIDMKYGYPMSDSAGNTFIFFPDMLKDDDPSAVKWVSFFPRKFIVNPLDEQTVRISAKPKDLKDGEYWGRPVIVSREMNYSNTLNQQQINAGLKVEFRTVIALNYRKGKVFTSVNFENLNCTYEENKFIVFSQLRREGNAAYIGNITAKISDEKGKLLKEVKQEISVYYTLNKKIIVETGTLPKGIYTVNVQLNTDREETGGKILKGNTAEKKITVSVN
jgi:P pilus assembly chaperone PapD